MIIRTVVIMQYFIALLLLNSSFLISAPIYRWVDKTGVKNFSNFPASVPSRVFEQGAVKVSEKYISQLPLKNQSAELTEDDLDKEYRAEIKRQLERHLLVSKYKELRDRQSYLQEQLALTRKSAIKTKREFDHLIIRGHFSDHSILELKRYQREIKRLNAELRTIEPKKRKIISFAGKRGISEKHFIN